VAPVIDTLRVLFLGANSTFSTTVLSRLCEANVRIAGVLSYGFGGAQRPPRTPLSVSPPSGSATLASLAENFGLPTLFAHDLAAGATLRRLRGLQADIFLSACFPRQLPARLWRLPEIACLNVHPSMLPAYRGPAPIFWQLRNGERELGVTLHRMDAELDAGPILLQRGLALNDGLVGSEIGRLLGRVGAALFIEAMPMLTTSRVHYVLQDASAASYHPSPQPNDFALDPDWSAGRAFNFMRATEHYCKPYAVHAQGQTLLLRRAGFCAEIDDGPHYGLVAIPFRCGILYAEPVRNPS